MNESQVLIIGASNNPSRYSYRAAQSLSEKGYQFIPMGVKKGDVFGEPILPPMSEVKNIDTVTMYVNPQLQESYKNFILALKPRRVIFNPGTENEDFYPMLESANIEVLESCTLVMLATRQF